MSATTQAARGKRSQGSPISWVPGVEQEHHAGLVGVVPDVMLHGVLEAKHFAGNPLPLLAGDRDADLIQPSLGYVDAQVARDHLVRRNAMLFRGGIGSKHRENHLASRSSEDSSLTSEEIGCEGRAPGGAS